LRTRAAVGERLGVSIRQTEVLQPPKRGSST